ncbi:mitogen-activated protein kinase kinase kinase 18-like [Solanum pennellii]|uniref:Mitogen-activated protein kinase kinase kinase 18-like n=1 Tax=Solanum pennellii TaxID=28526 RepID=A0ABM1VEA0_SOLPN|nr:mitogen-activated protein kinase kinase kinase 18-like [Solanum pennellii]
MSWKKLKLLGRGSYGTVSLATPLTDYYTLFAAVKSAQDDRSSSLRAEAQILHALRGSEYVIKCFGEDVSIENGKKTYNLFLEYAAAGTLNDLIHKSNTVLGEAEAAYYAFQILVGICHVHRKGFIHCDLKPANILVFPGGQHRLASVKLADFGVSLRSETKSCWDTSVKKRSRCRGTLLYAPPESVVCGIQDKGVDIWAFGCILVEMLTGKRVWSECKNKKELKLKIEHEKPEIPNNISNDAKHFLSKCLDRDHNWRWNAEMLLHHPFITNYLNKKIIRELIERPFGNTARLRPFVSMENLFTTPSFYYHHHNSSSDLRGSSSIITRPPETNNDNARGTTIDEMNFRNLHI